MLHNTVAVHSCTHGFVSITARIVQNLNRPLKTGDGTSSSWKNLHNVMGGDGFLVVRREPLSPFEKKAKLIKA